MSLTLSRRFANSAFIQVLAGAVTSLDETNKPVANRRSDSNHRKYPSASWVRCGPKVIIQCVLKRKAAAATHADHRRSSRDPRNTTHGEHNTNNSVVIKLR